MGRTSGSAGGSHGRRGPRWRWCSAGGCEGFTSSPLSVPKSGIIAVPCLVSALRGSGMSSSDELGMLPFRMWPIFLGGPGSGAGWCPSRSALGAAMDLSSPGHPEPDHDGRQIPPHHKSPPLRQHPEQLGRQNLDCARRPPYGLADRLHARVQLCWAQPRSRRTAATAGRACLGRLTPPRITLMPAVSQIARAPALSQRASSLSEAVADGHDEDALARAVRHPVGAAVPGRSG